MKKSSAYVQGVRGATRIGKVFSDIVESCGYNSLFCCGAYVTVAGIKEVRSLFTSAVNPQIRFIIGLDDYVSEPDAIDIAMNTRNAEVRVAGRICGHSSPRFHPKMYAFGTSRTPIKSVFIGSANITATAFSTNVECLLQASTPSALRAAELAWQTLWDLAVDPEPDLLRRYRQEFEKKSSQNSQYKSLKAAEKRVKTAIKPMSTIQTARLCWTELGHNTAGGGQLDIAKPIASFLDLPLPARPGTIAERRIVTPGKGRKKYSLAVQRGMWRFMNLQQGFENPLRPNPNARSPYTLVIERKDRGALEMRIVKNQSRKARDLRRASDALGTLTKPPYGRKMHGWI